MKLDQYLYDLNPEIVKEIEETTGMVFVPKNKNGTVCFANNNDELRDEFKVVFTFVDVLNYMFAVLFAPKYQKEYKELKITDFPLIPYPKDAATFWKLVKLGGEIREIHLLDSPIVEQYITNYPVDGDNVVGKIRFEENYEVRDGDNIIHMVPQYAMGRVYINETQYFGKVPQVAWEFYIGGYQPAQKWLKDRKGRKLEFDDIFHYQKIIVSLSETDRLMKAIAEIE